MLTIIASMERELSGLRRELRSSQHAGQFPHLDWQVVGIGAAQAGRRLTSLLHRQQAAGDAPSGSQRGIMLLGFAGGVDPSLAPGALAISSHYRPISGGNPQGPDPQMWRQAQEAATDAGLLFDQSDSLTVGQPDATVADKDELFHRYQVGTVNMEDYAVAAAAGDAGVPFLAVRAVLDPAGQSLPPYVLAMSGSPVNAVVGAALRPWRIAPMLQLGRQMRLAQFALTRFALSYLHRSLNDDPQRNDAWPADAAARRLDR